jgi:hypothetical protein
MTRFVALVLRPRRAGREGCARGQWLRSAPSPAYGAASHALERRRTQPALVRRSGNATGLNSRPALFQSPLPLLPVLCSHPICGPLRKRERELVRRRGADL